MLLDEESLEKLPVSELALQRYRVVKCVHLNVQAEVARENFSDQKAVAEVPLGVLHGIGKVQRLDPFQNLARQS